MEAEDSNYLSSLDKNELFELVLRDCGGAGGGCHLQDPQRQVQHKEQQQQQPWWRVWGGGRFQRLLLLLSLVASLTAAANHLSPVFLAFQAPFKCLR